MRLSIDRSSIKKILDRIKKLKEKIQKEMINELLTECCNAIIRRSNEKLQVMDLGENVKAEIATSWYQTKISPTMVSLMNSSDKSVYVEFGVGIKGQQNPHERAGIEGYEYNVPSEYKIGDSWAFKVDGMEDIDLPSKDYTTQLGLMGKTVVVTEGTPATMFVFNSIQDFIMDKEAVSIWERVKNKYLR